MKTIYKVVLLLLLTPPIYAVPVQGHKILISAASPLAVEAGQRIAEKGGNVIDVAVTVGLVMSVTSPYFASLGGGGFAVVKMNNAVEALDFREMAPAATSQDYYLKLPATASTVGGHAVGVPGIPAGYVALHKKYGKLKWTELFADATQYAQHGFLVSGEWVKKTSGKIENFDSSAKKWFLKKDGSVLKPGERLKQPQLATALRKLRIQGHSGFYTGAIAKDIVASITTAGGKMTLTDLKNYKVRWLKPLTTTYSGYSLYLMPPPSSGGVVIFSALKLMEKLNLTELSAYSGNEMHVLAEIENRAFRGRSLLGDPDFSKIPLDFLTSEKYLKDMADSISSKKVKSLKPLSETDVTESSATTHFSILDSEGHGIAVTITLNGDYGSGVATRKYGIALNNEMDDFTTRPGEPNMFGLIQGAANKVEPGKRPLSSMSPTLVEKDGKLVMAIGAPGGPRIISSVLQVLYRTLGRGQDLDIAVQAPRVHQQFLPKKLYVDTDRFAPEILQDLKKRGHEIEESWMGRVFVVRKRPDGILEGTFDSRGEGAVGGI